MTDTRRCVDCGYLSLRRYDERNLVDADDEYRRTAGIPALPGAKYQLYEDYPICFVRAFNLREEIGKPHERTKALAVIEEQRDCLASTEWQQGFTPKEHLEMVQKNALLECHAKIERDRDEQLREWRKEDVALAKDAMKVTVRSYIVAAAIGFLGALAAVSLAKWLG